MKNEKLLYQILLAVEDSRTITDLADNLFMSQPYISQVIKNAERQYHTTLIKRSPLPIELTESGKTLLYDLIDVIDSKNNLLTDMSQYDIKSKKYISIGFDQPLLTVEATKIIEKLMQSFPNINFRINEMAMNMADRRLQIRKTDIIDGRMENNNDFFYEIAHKEKLCLLVTSKSKLFNINPEITNLNSILLKSLDGENFISRERGFFQPLINQMFTRHGVHINSTIQLDNSITITQMAEDGLGNAVTFKKLITNNKSSKYRIFNIPSSFLNFDMGIAYRKHSPKIIKEIAQKMIEIVKTEN